MVKKNPHHYQFFGLGGLNYSAMLNAEQGWQLLKPHVNPPISTVRVLGELTAANRLAVQKKINEVQHGIILLCGYRRCASSS